MDTYLWHPAHVGSALSACARVAMVAALLLYVAIVTPLLVCFYSLVPWSR